MNSINIIDLMVKGIENLKNLISIDSTVYLSQLIKKANNSKDEIDLLQEFITNHKNNVEIIIDIDFSTSKQLDLSECHDMKISCYPGTKITHDPVKNDPLFIINNAYNITFKDIECHSTNHNSFLIGNELLAYNIQIFNCKVYDVASLLMTHKIHDIKVENNYAYNSYGSTFAFLNNPYNVYVNNNVIDTGVNVQIKVYSTNTNVEHKSENIIITNNHISNVTQGTGEWDMAIGIEINENSYNCIVSNNIITSCKDMAISLSGIHKVTCNGNIINGTSEEGYGTGIEIVSCSDWVCNNNSINKTKTYGIIIDKSCEGIVDGNNIVMIKSIWDPEDFCILIGGEANPKNCHNIIVSNNKLKHGTYGIRFNENIENVKINNNLFQEIQYRDISCYSESDTITKQNIFINGNTFNSEINFNTIKNLFINDNIFNFSNTENGTRSETGAIYIEKNSKFVNVINNIINNCHYIVVFESDENDHIKASNVRILNNVIDYSGEVVNNADNVPIEDFYVFGNIDSSNATVTLDK